MKTESSKTTTLFRSIIIVLGTLLTQLNAAAQCNSFKIVSAGYLHSIGIKTDGSLWAWGYNSNSQLGDGTTTQRNSPVPIAEGTTWVAVSAGYRHTIGIQSDGSVWGWGFNDRGQIDGSGGTITTPKLITTAGNWQNAIISAGQDYTLAISNGDLYAWGSNGSAFGYGRLGNGSNSSYTVPTLISSGWRTVSAAFYHSLGIKTDGTLWVWGDNNYGQLGNGTTGGSDQLTPLQIGTDMDWTDISAGGNSFCVGIKGGKLFTWGRNQQYQLGDGTTIDKNAPQQIGTDNWSNIDAGMYHTIAKQANGTLYGWGGAHYGEAGAPAGVVAAPRQIGIDNDWSSNFSAGDRFTFLLKNNASLWFAGGSGYGQSGTGASGVNITTFTQVAAGGGYSGIAQTNASAFLLPTNGTLNHFVNNCALLASITPNGANAVSGATNARVWIDATQPLQYVKRHYQITPDNNANTATGKVTLYFTQQDFNDFNYPGSNSLKLPNSPTDIARKANLRIEKRSGNSNDGTGLPNSYIGSVTTIDPIDSDIVWNSTSNMWEVSFEVDGFSGFFVKTMETALPVHFGAITAHIRHNELLVNWSTETETNNHHFEIQASKDGEAFSTIGTVQSKAVSGNSNQTLLYTFKQDLASNTVVLGFSFIIGCFVFAFKKRKSFVFVLLGGVMIAGGLACSRNKTEVLAGKNEHRFVRIVQVDKDGTEKISKAVQIIYSQD